MALPDPRPIREVENIDRAMLDAEIRPLRRPVVMRGFARDWPAVQAGRTSPEAAIAYLKRFSGTKPVAVVIAPPEARGRFFYTGDLKGFNFQRSTTTLGPFLEQLLYDQANGNPHAIAVQSAPVPEILPGFAEENRLDLLDPAVIPRIWIGNALTVSIHSDLMENIGIVMTGRRRFTVFPPEQIANLYMGPFKPTPAGTPVSLVDLADPDLTRFPRFAEAMAAAQQAVLEPGDAIYLPFHWWHSVESLDPVNAFVNYWWNFPRPELGNPYDALKFAMMALHGLPDDQRDVWRMLFDHYVFGANGDPGAHLPPDVRGILGPVTPEQLARLRAKMAVAAIE